MRGSQNDSLWAEGLRRLEGAQRALEGATAALVDLTECAPDNPDEADRRAFDRSVALEALAIVENESFYLRRILRGERIEAVL